LNYKRPPKWLWIFILILGLGILSLLTWGNYKFTQSNPGGTDFLVHWMGTKNFIKEGVSPYSEETTREIQILQYGREARVGEPDLKFISPFYSIALYLPFAFINDFNVALGLWMTFLEVGVLLLLWSTLRLVDWRPDSIMLAGLAILTLFWFHSVRPLVLGSSIIWVSLALVFSLIALKANQDELAGVLLAFSTIKPMAILFPILFILIWAGFQKRWKIVFWFLSVTGLLFGLAFLFLPNWVMQNLSTLIPYLTNQEYGTPALVLEFLLPVRGTQVGQVISIISGAALLFEWIISFRQRSFSRFLWTVCLTMVLGQWLGVPAAAQDFIILYPAIILGLYLLEARWHRSGRLFGTIFGLLFFAGIWAIFLGAGGQIAQPQLDPALFFPLPLITLIMMYWVRWWANQPNQTWFDSLSRNSDYFGL
jgi:hypothetical protein